MTHSEFRDLCRSTCLALDLPDTEQLGNHGQIEVDGVSIGAYFDEETDIAIHCYVDLGEVDAASRPEIFAELLQFNLELGRMHGEALGFDADSGRVVLRSEIRNPDQCDGEQMAGLFRDYASFAREFRVGGNLENPGSDDVAMQGLLA